jgi:hypothetical protein
MLQDRRPGLFRYLFPVALIVLGGWLMTWNNWDGVGSVVICVAILLSVSMMIVDILRERQLLIKEQTYFLEADTAHLAQIEKMSEEDKNFARRDYRIKLAERQKYLKNRGSHE